MKKKDSFKEEDIKKKIDEYTQQLHGYDLLYSNLDTNKDHLEKFKQKYTKLSAAQKNLLREYINNISNTNSLKDTLKEIIKGLKEDLQTHSKNLKDKVVKIKMNEAIKLLCKH